MTTSRIALAAAAGLLLGAAMTPAKAADLGGGCCADLEERVAELEATTARKGNRVVSLQVYGQVNKALLIWDDGIDSDAYIVDNTLASSRFGMVGKASITPGFTAGYNIEFEINDARADHVFNTYEPDPNDPTRYTEKAKHGDEGYSDGLTLRQNNFFVESDKYGRITVGHGTVAAGGATEVVLANSLRNSDSNIGAAMAIRSVANPHANYGRLNWGGDQFAWNYDGGDTQNDVIRYDSPSIYGFILSASWGDNDYSDVALRFKKDFGVVRVGAAIAYVWDNSRGFVELGNIYEGDNYDSETLKGSISAMHMPTGLYASFAAGQRDFESASMQDDSFWYVQAGIERKFLPYGSTTIYGEYGEYSNFSKYILGNGGLNDSEATRWGFGINQRIDAAAMDIYAHATVWSFEDNYAKERDMKYEDLSTILIGSRIQF